MRKNKILVIIVLILLFFSSCSIFHILPSSKIKKIEFNETEIELKNCDFVFSNYQTNNYLDSLRKEFKLNSLVINADTELQKALILLNWTNSRWEHHGKNKPKKSDAISILQEAETGKNFRCVEYAIVLSSALKSIGIPARTIGLKTKDVEITRYGAGHVVTEAYLADFNKWIFLDGQKNYVPFLKNKPLNGVELQNAIINSKEQLELKNFNQQADKKEVEDYIKWVGKYLFYFDTKFDNREGEINKKIKYKGKSCLMLVPIGAKNPKLFQRKHKMNYLIYTNNLKDFYKEPKIMQ